MEGKREKENKIHNTKKAMKQMERRDGDRIVETE